MLISMKLEGKTREDETKNIQKHKISWKLNSF